MIKTAVLCNSTNSDLVRYFRVKVGASKHLKRVRFFASREVAASLGVSISSYSKVSSFSFWFLLDCIYSFVLFFRFFLFRYKRIIFDTAHISNLPIAFLAKLLRIELVFTIHDWNPHPGKQARAVALYNLFVRKYLADSFITFSSVECDKPVHRFTLSGFPLSKSLEPEGYFLFFGRIESYKGLEHLNKICQKMHMDGFSHHFIIAGKGENCNLSLLRELPNVRVLNYFHTDEELSALISRCIAVVLPYSSATQSGVIIQAYSHGKPVVAHRVGAIPEYVNEGGTGRLVSIGEYDQYCMALIDVEKNYLRYSRFVSREFQERYSESACANQWLSMLDSFDRVPV